MVSRRLVSSKNHHGDDQGTKTGQRFNPLYRDRSHPLRHDRNAPGESDLHPSLGGSELGQAPRGGARKSGRANPPAAKHAHPCGADPLVYRYLRDDLALAAEQADSSGVPGAPCARQDHGPCPDICRPDPACAIAARGGCRSRDRDQ